MTTIVDVHVKRKSKPQMVGTGTFAGVPSSVIEHKGKILIADAIKALPAVLVAYGEEVKLGVADSNVLIAVDCYEHGGANLPDVRVSIRFSNAKPSNSECLAARNRLNSLIVRHFRAKHIRPKRIMVDVGWEPTYGIDNVDDEQIKWCP